MIERKMNAEAQRRREKRMVRGSKVNPALWCGYHLACHREEQGDEVIQSIRTGLLYGNHFQAARIDNRTSIITISSPRLRVSAFQK
jgi:hypothetical protein